MVIMKRLCHVMMFVHGYRPSPDLFLRLTTLWGLSMARDFVSEFCVGMLST